MFPHEANFANKYALTSISPVSRDHPRERFERRPSMKTVDRARENRRIRPRASRALSWIAHRCRTNRDIIVPRCNSVQNWCGFPLRLQHPVVSLWKSDRRRALNHQSTPGGIAVAKIDVSITVFFYCRCGRRLTHCAERVNTLEINDCRVYCVHPVQYTGRSKALGLSLAETR